MEQVLWDEDKEPEEAWVIVLRTPPHQAKKIQVRDLVLEKETEPVLRDKDQAREEVSVIAQN